MIRWFCFFMLLTFPIFAMEAGEALPSPIQEKRAIDIFNQLRCVVCQSEAITESPADMAKDLRALVREQISQGLSDQQILNFVHERYGDYVLLKPPLKNETALLWFIPIIFLGIGTLICWLFIRKQNIKKPSAL
jgi:cytochrome c-type biogenesis protein CcmH